MNRNRKLQVAALTLSAGITIGAAGITANAAPLAGASTFTAAAVTTETTDRTALAGASLAVANLTSDDASSSDHTTLSGVNLALASIVSDASTADEDDTVSENVTTAVASSADEEADDTDTEETSKYDDMAVCDVNDYSNVRSKNSTSSKVVGKIYDGDVCTVLKTKGSWVKIESGDVTGWMKKEYLKIGDEKAIKKASKRVAVVKTTTLRVRSKASKKSEVVDLAAKGDKLTVKSISSEKDGWIKVSGGYVSADYVKVKRVYHHAETIAHEKARLAAEAAAKAESQQSSAAADSSSSSESSSASSDSSVSYTTQSSSVGSQVASYACQFVGNPYVWGGTSLTDGADCSGFVMSVYAHFGYSLPHSSASDRSVGVAVSTSDLQPGDIICYSGHVAIYIGGGQIVHASNPTDGIKISNASYRSIVAARRIL